MLQVMEQDIFVSWYGEKWWVQLLSSLSVFAVNFLSLPAVCYSSEWNTDNLKRRANIQFGNNNEQAH